MKIDLTCDKCGGQMEFDAEESKDNRHIFECPYCGSQIVHIEERKVSNMQNINDPSSAAAREQYRKLPASTAKNSALAIIAFVLSLTVYCSLLGAILGIVELVISKSKANRKRGLAIAAIIIGIVFTVVSIQMIISGELTLFE